MDTDQTHNVSDSSVSKNTWHHQEIFDNLFTFDEGLKSTNFNHCYLSFYIFLNRQNESQDALRITNLKADSEISSRRLIISRKFNPARPYQDQTYLVTIAVHPVDSSVSAEMIGSPVTAGLIGVGKHSSDHRGTSGRLLLKKHATV